MEVELRIKVPSFEHAKQFLQERGVRCSSLQRQEDLYFKPKGKEREELGPGSSVLRIRRISCDGKESAKLTFKAYTKTKGSCEEYETHISDADAMQEILIRSEYSIVLRIIKEREEARLGKILYCFDHVEGLGTFIELEIVSDDPVSAKKTLLEAVQALGYSKEQVVENGYYRMLASRQGISFKD